MQETWQDEDGSNDLLYRAILHSTAAAIYHWLTQDGDRKKEKHGFSDMYMYCHFWVYNFDLNLCKLKLYMKRDVYSTVCHRLPKIFPRRKYKIAKLSKLNISLQTTLKIFIAIVFVQVPNHFEKY